MIERPRYSKWSRKTGGVKICSNCQHKHRPVMRMNGRARRVKVCMKCGTPLPAQLTYPKRGQVRWYVREFDPGTGNTTDHAVRSSEAGDEFIRRCERDFTPDPIQRELLEYASVLVRQIHAEDRDDAVNQLIVKLGGDSNRRKLKRISWEEGVETICSELTDKGRSATYVGTLRRIMSDLRQITGVDDLRAIDLDIIAKWRSVRMKGGWMRDGFPTRPIKGSSINTELGIISSFIERAVRKRWAIRNVLRNAVDERVKVRAPRVDYMPDDDLRKILAAADPWMRAFIVVAYYSAARRSDLLRLKWDRDVDLDGSKAAAEGRIGPHVYICSHKADTPHWIPLHSTAVAALRQLRRQPRISPRVFDRCDVTSLQCKVSNEFARLCIKVGLTEPCTGNKRRKFKNKWSLHDLRRKANTDLRNQGASPKERAALLGHRTTRINESHYEAVIPARQRELIDGLPTFGMTA